MACDSGDGSRAVIVAVIGPPSGAVEGVDIERQSAGFHRLVADLKWIFLLDGL